MQLKSTWQQSDVRKVFKGLNEYTMQEKFNNKHQRQVETSVKYISSTGPLTGTANVSLPSLSNTEMHSAEDQSTARVSERKTEEERKRDAGIRAFRTPHTDY